MAKKKTFRDLIVWRKSVELAKLIYLATRSMASEERFGLTAQMRKAAVSVPSNIAEGNARQTLNDYLHFLSMSRASLAELETQILIAQELNMLKDADRATSLVAEVDRMLQALIRSLQEKRRGKPN